MLFFLTPRILCYKKGKISIKIMNFYDFYISIMNKKNLFFNIEIFINFVFISSIFILIIVIILK